MKTKLFLIILFITIPSFCFSTCIVILKTDKEIIVGADSKRTIYAINTISGQVDDIIINDYCKINKTGKFYFVISGFDDGKMLINAQKACNTSKTLEEVVVSFSSMMKKDYEHSIEQLRNANNEKYIERFEGSDAGGISFFCFINNRPELRTLFFTTKNKPSEKTLVVVSKHINQAFTALGVHDHIDKLSDSEINNIFSKGNLVYVIKTLIKLEEKHHPNWVGQPIDILTLNSKQAKWISKKPNCN